MEEEGLTIEPLAGDLRERLPALAEERVHPEHERVARIVAGRGVGERQHVRELPLPEPDEVEALEHQEVPRVVREMRSHRDRRVVALALHEEGETFDVATLPIGL